MDLLAKGTMYLSNLQKLELNLIGNNLSANQENMQNLANLLKNFKSIKSLDLNLG